MNRALACENEYSDRLTAAERHAEKVAARFTALWSDPEVLSEVVTDLHGPLIYIKPGSLSSIPNGRFTGEAALAALRDGDYCVLGLLLYKACKEKVQAMAEEQVTDEESEA